MQHRRWSADCWAANTKSRFADYDFTKRETFYEAAPRSGDLICFRGRARHGGAQGLETGINSQISTTATDEGTIVNSIADRTSKLPAQTRYTPSDAEYFYLIVDHSK